MGGRACSRRRAALGTLGGGLVGARHAVDWHLAFSFTHGGINREKKKEFWGEMRPRSICSPGTATPPVFVLEELTCRCWNGSAWG